MIFSRSLMRKKIDLRSFTFDFVSFLPSSSMSSTPFLISFCLIRGMLAQLAAATAANGTYLWKFFNFCVSNSEQSKTRFKKFYFNYYYIYKASFFLFRKIKTLNCVNFSIFFSELKSIILNSIRKDLIQNLRYSI